MIFSTLYLSEDVDTERFIRFLTETTVHVTVVICPTRKSAVADAMFQLTRSGIAADHKEGKDVVYVYEKTFLVLHKRVVSSFMVQSAKAWPAKNDTGMSFAVAQVQLQACSTAVAVGIVDVPPDADELPAWLLEAMHDAVMRRGVRVLTGVFGCAQQQMSELAQNLPIATERAIVQEWLTDGSPQLRSTSSGTSVFPSYTLLIGTCSKFTTPNKEVFLPARQAMDQGWCSAVAELDDTVPQWWPWTQQQIAWYGKDDMDWGHIKMKKVDPERWFRGCHQVVWWCGTAKQGKGAAKRQWAKRSERA